MAKKKKAVDPAKDYNEPNPEGLRKAEEEKCSEE